jgi:phosphoadenosine phosphosulfate reductase
MKTKNKNNINNSVSIDKYSTLGLRRNWLLHFFNTLDNCFENNDNLGSKQIYALINWLRDSGLLEIKNKKVTNQCKELTKVLEIDEIFVWQIIWINLYNESKIVKWYVDEIGWNTIHTKRELLDMLIKSFPGLSEATLNNPLTALMNTFDSSPLGSEIGYGILEKKGKAVKKVKKSLKKEISPFIVAYSLYKMAEQNNQYAFTLSEIYNEKSKGGPYNILGIPKERLKDTLRYLQENKNCLLKVDLTADLDNIHLSSDIRSKDIIGLIIN